MTCDNHGIMLIISYAKGEYCPLFEESKPYLKIVVNWEAYADKALKILNKINAFFLIILGASNQKTFPVVFLH